MFKKSKIALSIVITLILCLGVVSTVFAATPPTGEPDAPAQAGITKILKVPEGTVLPENMSFNFKVDKASYNGDTSGTAKNQMPDLGAAGDVNIPVSATRSTTANGITTYVMESGDLLGINWTNTGIYIYTITEVDESKISFYNQDTGVLEEPVYSKAAYTLAVHVREGVNKDGDKVFYVYYTEGIVVTPDNPALADVGTKVVPTPGGSEVDYYEYSQIIFTNTYAKTNLSTDPTDGGPLAVSKTVKGDYASTEQFFEYKLTVTSPIYSAEKGPFLAYIVEKGAVVDLSDADNPNTADGNNTNGDYISFTNDTQTTFHLKDGQRLVFLNTPVGTAFTSIETGITGYTPSVQVNGKTFPNLSTGLQYVADGTGTLAAYTNTNDGTTPTGINLNNLPFIGMIILAIWALIIFIAVKFRKRKTFTD